MEIFFFNAHIKLSRLITLNSFHLKMALKSILKKSMSLADVKEQSFAFFYFSEIMQSMK